MGQAGKVGVEVIAGSKTEGPPSFTTVCIIVVDIIAPEYYNVYHSTAFSWKHALRDPCDAREAEQRGSVAETRAASAHPLLRVLNIVRAARCSVQFFPI